jgi:deoxyribonucleoside regulator
MIDDRIIARVAEMFYLHGVSQYEIAQKFSFSKAKVCRIIKEAKKRNIVTFSVKKFEKIKIDLEEKMEVRFGLKEAIIYPDSDLNDYDENIIFKEIGLLGSGFLKRIIKDETNIALTWGKTLYYMIKNVSLDKKYKVNVFSTLGGVSLTKAEYQNNNLVQMLSERLGGKSYPIYLPLVLERPEHKDMFLKENNIRKVIGGSSNIDYYFAGLGTISENSRMYTLGGFGLEFLKSLSTKDIAGEIGLNFFDTEGNFINTGIEDRTINMGIDEIRKIKNKVILCFGPEKVLPLKALLHAGIIDVLVTDSVTAESLMDR